MFTQLRLRTRVFAVTRVGTDRLERTPDGIVVHTGTPALEPVDELIVTTGLRPDLAMLSELRLGLDPALEVPTALAPLIDPNIHSCGTARRSWVIPSRAST